MKFKQIYAKDYPNNKYWQFSYTSDYYYKTSITKKANAEGWIFDWTLKKFETTFVKEETQSIFEHYKEPAEYHLVLENEEEIGLIVLGHLDWNRMVRIWDFTVDPRYHRRGIGTKLMQLAEDRAREWKCRALILECQTSNIKAVQFYLKYGFELIGCDTICYSNEDIERNEVRLEMAKFLE